MKLTNITVTRVIPAPTENVFDVWIDRKSPGGPWHGSERLILNIVVDGLFYFAVKHEGRTWPHYGRFVRIERPHRVEYTWVSEATKGVESVVDVTFEPRGDQCEVTLRHSGIPDDEMGRQHQEGWTWVLSMLAERFVSGASSPASA
ncbi:MAG TPA: SRPBCC domain-containing protein [Bryobacteraceae bacterium]|jgi:uncharacterized protein YndB with AHSA1/START domain|nr:SRPBCC domain-containing protein [Bryobacteraceae bacterium]